MINYEAVDRLLTELHFGTDCSAHDVVEAALGDQQVFGWCPDCNGEGMIYTMAPTPDLMEYAAKCDRCVEHEGLVQMWPEKQEANP